MKNTDPAQLETFAAFEQACKAAGLKLTHQRIEIYRELLRASDHPAAETIYRRLQRRLPSLSLDTVYRTLATFEGLSLVQKIPTKDGQSRFEVETGHHHHFICESCRKIIDFHWQDFDRCPFPAEIPEMGILKSKNVILKGLCRECCAEQKDGSVEG